MDHHPPGPEKLTFDCLLGGVDKLSDKEPLALQDGDVNAGALTAGWRYNQSLALLARGEPAEKRAVFMSGLKAYADLAARNMLGSARAGDGEQTYGSNNSH
jgi:hypothetical protein